MERKQIVLLCMSFVLRVEYRAKKTNTRPEGEHCVQLYPEHELGVEGSRRGEGKYTLERG